MYNDYYCSPMVTNCTFSGNHADGNGGGMLNNSYCSPTVINCRFTGNSAVGFGGGMYNQISDPNVANCTFSSNDAPRNGGGMYNYHSSPTIANCTFSDNSYRGMYNRDGSSPNLTNCIFSGNSGGGMLNLFGSSVTVTNCTFSGNLRYGIANVSCNLTATNCVLWGNGVTDGPEIHLEGNSNAWVSYSDVQGGQAEVYVGPGSTLNWSEGNIDADPLFVDADNDDYHLLPTSPCIDAGGNTAVPAGITTDLDGYPRFVDQPEVPDTGNGTAPIVDMGAFEANYIQAQMKFTPQALNPGSQGNWIKAHFVLPEEFLPEDVDTNTPAVIASFGIESDHINVFINKDGLVEIEVAFRRSDFCAAAQDNESTEVTAVGLLISGQSFYGTDTIRIITKDVAVLAYYWLEADCGEPDWCDCVDLDQDSIVNFVDFALFKGCCIEVIK
jgi:parallel beta-helix repeat protein